MYSPKNIELLMNISELEHRIALTGSRYKQKRFYDKMGKIHINHELAFSRIHMEYQGVK